MGAWFTDEGDSQIGEAFAASRSRISLSASSVGSRARSSWMHEVTATAATEQSADRAGEPELPVDKDVLDLY
jgi:hypothetical protein